MDKEIKQEIKALMKQGFREELAIITACANNGKPELAAEYLEDMSEEQDDIKFALEKLGMCPLHEAYKIPLTLMMPVEEPEQPIVITHHEITDDIKSDEQFESLDKVE